MSMDAPQGIMARLVELENDLANRQNLLEDAARKWFIAKRDKERARAVAFMRAAGTVAERNAIADQETAVDGKTEEAEWEATKAVCRVIETRVSIGQTLLKAHGRTG